jgi:uncharacterized protein involved in outer membrane biogenesis
MVKFVMRWAFRGLILLIVLVVALLLLKDNLVKGLAENRLRSETGMEVRIGRFEIALFSPTVTIQDFKLYNPPEFGGGVFVDMPELHVEYSRGALWHRELHLRLLRLNLSEVNVVESTGGQTNLEVLQARQKQRLGEPHGKVDFNNRILTDVKSGEDLTGVIMEVVLKNAPALLGVGGR